MCLSNFIFSTMTRLFPFKTQSKFSMLIFRYCGTSYSFSHSFNKYLLNTSYVANTVQRKFSSTKPWFGTYHEPYGGTSSNQSQLPRKLNTKSMENPRQTNESVVLRYKHN